MSDVQYAVEVPQKPTENVVLDLETTGTGVHSRVISIGAVGLSTGLQFYQPLKWWEQHGNDDNSTMEWWTEQDVYAKAELFSPTAVEADIGLKRFTEYLANFGTVYIWGNGADFDNVILKELYEFEGIPAPENWKYNSNRCYRTLKALFPEVPLPREEGIRHHALADAVYEAKHLKAILDRIILKT